MDAATIRDAVRSSPFRPFTLRMNDGREFFVNHPELIAVALTHLYVIDEKTQRGIFLEPMLVASMQLEDDHARKKRRGS